MINSWNTFVTILKDHGITEWGGGDKIEDTSDYHKSKYVYTLKNGRLGFWGDLTYEEALNEPIFRRIYGGFTHINIDELTTMDNFFFESIVKKVLDRL